MGKCGHCHVSRYGVAPKRYTFPNILPKSVRKEGEMEKSTNNAIPPSGSSSDYLEQPLDRKSGEKGSGIAAFFSRLGNLPEWKVKGEHLAGSTLNWAIGFIASCGFLMFG